MATLHTVNKSPYERDSLDSCLRQASEGSAVLMIEDAVVAAIDGSQAAARLGARAAHVSLFVLGPDLAARGIAPERLLAGVTVVDYEGFVELTVEYDRVSAWL